MDTPHMSLLMIWYNIILKNAYILRHSLRRLNIQYWIDNGLRYLFCKFVFEYKCSNLASVIHKSRHIVVAFWWNIQTRWIALVQVRRRFRDNSIRFACIRAQFAYCQSDWGCQRLNHRRYSLWQYFLQSHKTVRWRALRHQGSRSGNYRLFFML